jgi:hypothetical protein
MPTETRRSSPIGATPLQLEDLPTLQREINKGSGVKNAAQARQFLSKLGWLDATTNASPTQLMAFLLTAEKNAKQYEIADIIRSVAYILDNTIVESIAANITDKVEMRLKDTTEEMKKEFNELSARTILLAEQSAENNTNSQSLEAKIDADAHVLQSIPYLPSGPLIH